MSAIRKVFVLRQVEIPWGEIKKGDILRASSTPSDTYGNDKQWSIATADGDGNGAEVGKLDIRFEIGVSRHFNIPGYPETKRISVAASPEGVKDGEHFVPIFSPKSKGASIPEGFNPTVSVDWIDLADYPLSECSCKCGRVFYSQAKYVHRDEYAGMITQAPCPSCGKDNNCCRVSSGWDRMEL